VDIALVVIVVLGHALGNHEQSTPASPKIIAAATKINLRQQEQRKQSETTFITASHESTGCIDQWHVSIEDPHACTNSHIFPTEWAHASIRDYIFHNTPGECCQDVIAVSGKCDTINTCDVATNYYDVVQQETTNDYLNGATCDKTTWHMSTEALYACTNDGIYPDAWNKPKKSQKYLFSSGAECCERSYPYQSCQVIDTCPTPPPTPQTTSRPTRPPRTRKPRPTKKPTSEPTPTHDPTPHPSTTPPDWYVDRATNQCVMDCVDEPRRPCRGHKGAWDDSFPTVEECCESISWVPSEDCVATASPTRKKTDAPTREVQGDDGSSLVPTLVPTVHFDWYKERATNRCVLHCENKPGRPCGGLAGQWETRYASVEECCASVPWKPFDDCASTASPVTASPTTSVPTISPTTSVPPSTTHNPSSLTERMGKPSSSPTLKPTADCPAPHWYLFRNGASSTCINDETYSDDVLNPSMKFYLPFDSAGQCCDVPFAGSNCLVIDVCNIVVWYADYSRGWDDGVCVNANQAPIPKGRRTYDNQRKCCVEGFFGQSSEACLSNAV